MKIIQFLTFLLLLLVYVNAEAQISEQVYVNGVSDPIVNLNGTWQLCLEPDGRFWEKEKTDLVWNDIQVPGEVMMQGYPIKHDKPFAYKKSFFIPQDFKDKIVKLRFEGVYSFARIWVNGIFIRDHHGGFTAWDCDISDAVIPGENATLIVEVTDRSDEISFGSGYAKHQIGGILRNVKLLALPEYHPENIFIRTDLDSNFQNANLIVSGIIRNAPSQNTVISLELFDQNNNAVPLNKNFLKINKTNEFSIVNPIQDPLKWDAEHPNLYTLKLTLSVNNEITWYNIIKTGFREISVEGNKLLVNGKEVKLRGACRHDIHPLLGRLSTSEYDLKDVLLAKEANMNFIRTSHYPPSDNFLSLCDKYGLYVEDETAVCFVGSHRTEEYRPGDTENDADFTDRYLNQLAEMVDNHKNHPSIIIWSIGNENEFGSNFKKSFDWVKENDDTRPVIFSYPGKVPEGIKSYEILSMHYPDTSGNLNQYGIQTIDFGSDQMPVIFDEWAHVACYNNYTVIEDPNIRDFWGRSLDMMWQKSFDADGGLGGAIWGMIDETFMLPDSLPGFNEWWGKIDKNVIPAAYTGNTVGYGEWGIVDTWRRKKPEFWNTKKAYSPVKLLQTEVEDYIDGATVTLPLYNRFDHTNIDELMIKVFYLDEERTIKSPSIKPHAKGLLKIDMDKWDPGIPVIIEFTGHDKALIDKYVLNRKSTKTSIDSISIDGNINVEETRDQLIIICNTDTKILFDKKNGLIQKIIKGSDTLLLSGPHINLRTKGRAVMYSYHEIMDYGENWNLKKLSYKTESNFVNVKLTGETKNLSDLEFNINIRHDGVINVQYQVSEMPDEFIRELGIRFDLQSDLDSLSWKRDPYWSYYPSDHLSSSEGTIALYTDKIKYYRTIPEEIWPLDTKSFYYEGTNPGSPGDQLTFQAKSTKESVFDYTLIKENNEILSVISSGKHSCRIAKNDIDLHLFINNVIDYIDLSWGNYQRNIKFRKQYRNDVSLKLF